MSVDCHSIIGFGIVLEPEDVNIIKNVDENYYYENLEDDFFYINEYDSDSNVFFGTWCVSTSDCTKIKSQQLSQISIRKLQQIGYISKLLNRDLEPEFYLLCHWW